MMCGITARAKRYDTRPIPAHIERPITVPHSHSTNLTHSKYDPSTAAHIDANLVGRAPLDEAGLCVATQLPDIPQFAGSVVQGLPIGRGVIRWRVEVLIGQRIRAVLGGHSRCVYGHGMGRNLRPVAVLGVLLAFALVVAACGGDQALSKDEYVAQGNAICEDANAKFEAVSLEFANLPDASNPEEFAEPLVADYVDQFTAVLEEQLADLRDLAAPEGDEDLLAALYDDLEAVLSAIPQLAAAAAAGDLAAIAQLTSNEDRGHAGLRVVASAFSDLDNQASEYGLTVCGE